MRGWGALLGAVAAEVVGSLSLRAAIDVSAFFALTAVAYVLAFALLSASLRLGMPLGVAYGVWGALGVALTALLSALLIGEPFTPVMAVGIVLVMAGVLLVELGSQAASRRRAAGASETVGAAEQTQGRTRARGVHRARERR